jgi:hypothetical protein
MPDSNTIASVSATLVKLLQTELATLGPAPTVELHDLSSAPSTAAPRLTVFLFDVGEDMSVRNRPRVRVPVTVPPGLQERKPPVALLLRYMLTAWSGGPATDQQILGRVVQILYDRPILSGHQLQGSLLGTDESLKVTLAPLSIDERTQLWGTLHPKYRLSLTYDVRVVYVDSLPSRSVVPTTRRTIDFAVPEALS